MSNPTLLGLTLTNEEYHKDTSRISKSGLDLVNKSPLHYHYKYLDPSRKTESENDMSVIRTARGMALAELAGKTIITLDEYNQWVAMNDAARRNKAVRFLLADKEGQAERTFYYNDPGTGVACRVRPDWLAVFNGWIVDIKTTVDASPGSFSRSIAKFRYHVQDPFYTDGLKFNGIDAKGFAFIVVEKTPPYPTAVYFLPKEAKQQGRLEIRRNLDDYALALKTGIWAGYVNDQLHEINLPPWAFK